MVDNSSSTVEEPPRQLAMLRPNVIPPPFAGLLPLLPATITATLPTQLRLLVPLPLLRLRLVQLLLPATSRTITIKIEHYCVIYWF